MADNDRWRNDQERGRYRSRDDQQGRAEGRYEDWGGRPDQGRFTGEGGSRGGAEDRYADRGRHEDFGGRPDQGRFPGESGRPRGGTEGYGYGGGYRGGGGYSRDDDRDRYGGEDRGFGSGGDRESGGFGGDYYSGFYGADQNYGRGRGEDRDRTYGRSSSDYARGGDQRGYLDTRRGDEWRRYADRGDAGRESYGREGYGGQDRSGPGYRGERGFFERMGDEVASWFGSDDAARRRGQDARQGDPGAQHHRGRGPKGYARSDERIREDVSDRLTDDPYVDASDIEVSVSGREVTLSGTVESREARRRAEDIAESTGGVTHVQNNLRVQPQGLSGGMASALGGATGASGTVTGGGEPAGSASRNAASQGVTTPPMGESITGMNSSDANRIAQETFGSTTDTTGSRRS